MMWDYFRVGTYYGGVVYILGPGEIDEFTCTIQLNIMVCSPNVKYKCMCTIILQVSILFGIKQCVTSVN